MPEKSGFFAFKMKSYMELAIEEAKKAFLEDEVPIGAVIIKEGKVLAQTHNLKKVLNDPTAHAEILAIKEATKVTGDWHLDDCEIYITAEPCPMCLGAILQTNIKKIVFGTFEPKLGAVESNQKFIDFPKYNNKVDVIGGVLENETKKLLKEFFQKKREK